MNHTKIEWVKNPDGTQGYTWNPITGCLKGCDYCYARKLANGRLKPMYLANENWAVDFDGYTKEEGAYFNPFYPRFWPERLDELNPVYGQDNRQPFKGIFVCNMSDLFGIGVPKDWTNRVLDRIREYPHHRFYLLTKQPQNLIKFSPFPDNCWVGMTATNPQALTNALYALLRIEAKVKFISFEPLLSWERTKSTAKFAEVFKVGGISLIIIGACTGTKQEMIELCLQYPTLTLMPYGNKWTAQPRIEWVKEVVEAADQAGVKVFLKDNLRPLIVQEKGGNEYAPSWANGGHGTLRQELPDEG